MEANKKPSFKDIMNYWQTTLFIVSIIAYVFCTTFLTIPEANQRTVDTALGFLLGSVIGTIVNYKYGTTSAKKADDQKTIDEAK